MAGESWLYTGYAIQLSASFVLTSWIVFIKNCKGISGRTQIISALVHVLRFSYNAIEVELVSFGSIIEGVLTSNSIVLLYLIYIKYKETIEKEFDTFWIELTIILSGGLSIVYNSDRDDPLDVLYSASWYLEASSLLPQMYFNLRTGSKKLSVSLYVLGCLVYKSIILYYLHKTWNETHYFNSTYPSYIQLGTCVLYFVQLILVPRYEETKALSDVESASQAPSEDTNDTDSKMSVTVVKIRRPQLHRQQSLLEMPFLKKSLPSTSSLANSITNESGNYYTNSIQSRRKFKTNIVRTESPLTTSQRPTLNRTISEGSSLYNMSNERDDMNSDDGIVFTIGTSKQKSFKRKTSLPETQVTDTPFTALNDKLTPVKPSFVISTSEETANSSLTHDETTAPTPSTPDQTTAPTPSTPDHTTAPTPSTPELTTITAQPTPKRKLPLSTFQPPITSTQPKRVRRKSTKPCLETNPRKEFGDISENLGIHETQSRHQQRRATVHQTKWTETSQHNWKLMASNFIGIDSRRVSIAVHQLPTVIPEDRHFGKHSSPRIKKKNNRSIRRMSLKPT